MTIGEAVYIHPKEVQFSQIGEMCRGEICREIDGQIPTQPQRQFDQVRTALGHPVQEQLTMVVETHPD